MLKPTANGSALKRPCPVLPLALHTAYIHTYSSQLQATLTVGDSALTELGIRNSNTQHVTSKENLRTGFLTRTDRQL